MDVNHRTNFYHRHYHHHDCVTHFVVNFPLPLVSIQSVYTVTFIYYTSSPTHALESHVTFTVISPLLHHTTPPPNPKSTLPHHHGPQEPPPAVPLNNRYLPSPPISDTCKPLVHSTTTFKIRLRTTATFSYLYHESPTSKS